jgi:hypothetical protein
MEHHGEVHVRLQLQGSAPCNNKVLNANRQMMLPGSLPMVFAASRLDLRAEARALSRSQKAGELVRGRTASWSSTSQAAAVLGEKL